MYELEVNTALTHNLVLALLEWRPVQFGQPRTLA